MVTLQMIQEAQESLKGIARKTPLENANRLGENIYIKSENLQLTGAFKIRGAYNKIRSLTPEEASHGVIACSAGNHAQGIALSATKLGIKSVICMPEGAPISKVEATRNYGAEVVLVPGVYDDAAREAERLSKEHGYTFAHPFNDPYVIAGQGTIGLEILEQLPEVEQVVVPIGGGGLISGVAFAIKQLKPSCKVIGVQAEGADAIAQSFHSHSYVQTDSVATIADGIAVKAPGDITVPLIQKYADDVVTVNDLEISEAVLLLMERCKQIVEPSGAAPVAAVLKGKVDVKGKNVVCLLSGGNIDVSFIQCIIEQGLVSRHRRLRFTVTLLDRPGSLGKLLNDIAALGANILSVEHDRLTAGLNPNEIDVHVSCEVGGKEHGDRVLDQLIQTGYHVKID